MIEKVIASLLARPAFSSLAREEFERLQKGGHLSSTELETLTAEIQAKLVSQAEAAKGSLNPLLAGLGKTLRESLDIPSRQEILDLTAALQANRTSTQETSSASDDAPSA